MTPTRPSCYRSSLALMVCAFLVACVVRSAMAQQARVSFDPATLALDPGEIGVLNIRLEHVTRLAGAEMHLAFDPTLLEIVDADPSAEGVQIAHGDFLSPDFVAQNTADPGAGSVDYAIVCLPVDKAVSGSGVLARVTLRALAEGETQVTVHQVLLADEEGAPIEAEVGDGVVVVVRSGPPAALWAATGLASVTVIGGLIVVVRRAARARRGI